MSVDSTECIGEWKEECADDSSALYITRGGDNVNPCAYIIALLRLQCAKRISR